METFRRAHAHKGAAFVEIYQNCNVFNDGAFEQITGKDARADMLDPPGARRADPLRRRAASTAWSLDPTAASGVVEVADVGEDAICSSTTRPATTPAWPSSSPGWPGAPTSRPRSACSGPSTGPSTAPPWASQLLEAHERKGPGDLTVPPGLRRHLDRRGLNPHHSP